jgi:hypothetical protein
MKQYTVTEKPNAQSRREGTLIEAANLTEAKRKASRMKCFYGTVLEISDDVGVLSIKENGKWADVEMRHF